MPESSTIKNSQKNLDANIEPLVTSRRHILSNSIDVNNIRAQQHQQQQEYNRMFQEQEKTRNSIIENHKKLTNLRFSYLMNRKQGIKNDRYQLMNGLRRTSQY